MKRMVSRRSLALYSLIVCLFTTFAAGNVLSFYDPTEDPIPYLPQENLFGPDYDIPRSLWKMDADKRINTYRKADLNIRVVDKNGDPLRDVLVHVELMRHDFHWGAVTNPGFLNAPKSDLLQTYFLKYFNSGGFENGLKPKQCEIDRCWKSSKSNIFQSAEACMQWFQEHGIPVRGHALVWEGERFLSSGLRNIWLNKRWSDEEKGERMVSFQADHIDHAVEKWDVFCWDVINEPRVNHLINDLLPDKNTFVEWFRLTGQARTRYNRDFQMYYNENQIASFVHKHTTFANYRDIYKSRIQEIVDAGLPIDGIGMQYRFRYYVEPEEIYRRLCDFEEFKLPYQATEFEIKPMKASESFSDAERKKMMAEALTVFFSHPNATGLWHWSFVDGPNGHLPHALFSYDGQPRPEAEQWIKMMEEDFNTDKIITTDQDGNVHVRGFKGIYKVTIGQDRNSKTSIITLNEDVDLKLIY